MKIGAFNVINVNIAWAKICEKSALNVINDQFVLCDGPFLHEKTSAIFKSPNWKICKI